MTGLPLEVRVARICTETSRWTRLVDQDTMATYGQLLYGSPDGDSALREIDNHVSIHTFAEAGEDSLIAFELQVIIECKHRDGLEIYGVPLSEQRQPTIWPSISDLARTQLLHHLTPDDLAFEPSSPLCSTGLLIQLKGEGSKKESVKPSDEQLVYKAGASLYDYIRFDTHPWLETRIAPFLEASGLLAQFRAAAHSPYVGFWQGAQRWMRNHLSDEQCREFNLELEGKTELTQLPGITTYVPIICVDTPLYQVSVNAAGEIDTITPVELLLTSMRLAQWPGHLRQLMRFPRMDAPVAIVSVEHLPPFLDRVVAWWTHMLGVVEAAEPRLGERAPLEAAFLEAIRHDRGPGPSRYNSSLGMDDELF